jgi:hypothetical protein
MKTRWPVPAIEDPLWHTNFDKLCLCVPYPVLTNYRFVRRGSLEPLVFTSKHLFARENLDKGQRGSLILKSESKSSQACEDQGYTNFVCVPKGIIQSLNKKEADWVDMSTQLRYATHQ